MKLFKTRLHNIRVRLIDPVDIPQRGIVNLAVQVPVNDTITKLVVRAQGSHENLPDMAVYVVAPDGEPILVDYEPDRGDWSLGNVYDLSSTFRGKHAGGIWQVRFVDFVNYDAGKLVECSLEIETRQYGSVMLLGEPQRKVLQFVVRVESLLSLDERLYHWLQARSAAKRKRVRGCNNVCSTRVFTDEGSKHEST